MLFTIIALPHIAQRSTLQELREFLYTHDFRYQNKSATGVPHITLAQGVGIEQQISDLKEFFVSAFSSVGPSLVAYDDVSNRVHERVYHDPAALERYSQGCSRVALLFNNSRLTRLSTLSRSVLAQQGCDTTDEYVSNIKHHLSSFVSPEQIGDCIADHMNICNYARIDQGVQAQTLIRETEGIQPLLIDTIALYSDRNEIVWSIQL